MPARYKSVEPDVARRLVESGAHVIDVRGEQEWAAGHVEGSDRVSVGQISKHSVGRADTVVVMCANGKTSKRGARKLAKAGYQTYHLDGGLSAWHDLGLPLTSTNGSRPTVL